MHADGTIDWTTHAGTAWTYRPEPLPGFGPGEGHHHAGSLAR